MAGNITAALLAARSGLLANQSVLSTISQNIANVNSVGYSRRVANLEQRTVGGVGAGVQVSGVTRQADEYLMQRIRRELSGQEQLNVRESYLSHLQRLLGTPGDNSSLSHLMAEFEAAVESLASLSDNASSQSEMVRQGQSLTSKLRSMSADIQELRLQADREISDRVASLNGLISGIEELNHRIVRNSSIGLDTSDMLDKRDLMLDEMSKLIDIQYFVRPNGEVTVYTKSGQSLVDNSSVSLYHARAVASSAGTTHAQGSFSGIYINPQNGQGDITSKIGDGQIKGLIDLRDKLLTGLQSQIDELAGEMRDNFNQIHNRGMGFPGNSSYTGTREFTNTDATISFGGATDTRLIIFDTAGQQVASTTMRTILGGAGPHSLTNVASSIQDWLTQTVGPTATATVSADGGLNISTGEAGASLVFRDEAAVATPGAAHSDAVINYDINADGVPDESVSGFANFFGLNDFFVTDLNRSIYESGVQDASFRSSSTSVLGFRDSTGDLGTITSQANDTLDDIAARINAGDMGVHASVVPDGAGERLRIVNSSGENLEIYETAGSLFSNIDMKFSDVSASAAIDVRADIVSSPSRVSRGAPQWDADQGVNGAYSVSINDTTIALQLATAFTSKNTFEKTGGLATLSSSYHEYASAIIGYNSNLSGANEMELEFQKGLVESLQNKSNNIRGVNLDEEMIQLALFEQAYSASARVISTIQDMFDTLENAI